MKKIFLLLFIAVLGVFIYISLQARGSEDSEFNRTTRYSLGERPTFRFLFGLHKDGDARKEYLNGTTPIIVEVVQPKNLTISENGLQRFRDEVEKITGRRTQLYNVDAIKGGSLKDADLNEIVKSFHRHLKAGQPNLFIIYGEDFPGSEASVGKTFREFGILVSHNKLVDLTKNYPEAMADYLASTLLHEFGHQLGLGHVDSATCVMNENVESPTLAAQFSGTYTPTEFCQMETDRLLDIKRALKIN